MVWLDMGSPMAKMDMGQNHTPGGCEPSSQQGHHLSTDRHGLRSKAAPITQLDMGHPCGSGTPPGHGWMQDTPVALAAVEYCHGEDGRVRGMRVSEEDRGSPCTYEPPHHQIPGGTCSP